MPDTDLALRPCQRCGELRDRCDCPHYLGSPHGTCRRCGALEGHHLLDFAHASERLICPPSEYEDPRVDPCDYCPHDNAEHAEDGCRLCGCAVPQ